MSTPPAPPYSIRAKFLGPVFELDATLTKNAQNMIFARNGTGKSFLSRALRTLDLHQQGRDLSKAALNLVSEEAPSGQGSFSILRGTETIGSIELSTSNDSPTIMIDDRIFHVFSEDFVQEELREREYEVDGKIENEISVDADTIKVDDAKASLEKAIQREHDKFSEIEASFDSEREEALVKKALINKGLGEYKKLSFALLIEKHQSKPEKSEETLTSIIDDLDKLKSIPSDPDMPSNLSVVTLDDFDVEALSACLEKETSPSSVSVEIKEKIETKSSFFDTGVNILKTGGLSECPFCEQDLSAPDTAKLIKSYIEYFSDAEEKHKKDLRSITAALTAKESQFTSLLSETKSQKIKFDALKDFLPSQKDANFDLIEDEFQNAVAEIQSIKTVVDEKFQNLQSVLSADTSKITGHIQEISKTISSNNQHIDDLAAALNKIGDERKNLQRKACGVFELEFARSHWSKIEELRQLAEKRRAEHEALKELERLAPTSDARSRVAETFELLLKEFFGSRYVFDKDEFVLKRENNAMLRGPSKTLSDGEKTAIAFCYFISCIHKKVSSNSDYKKVVMVFDDPVTSMSYDFIYAIAQTLRYVGISSEGRVSISPSDIASNKAFRPTLIILTHSTYFFNTSLSNKVVEKSSAFALYRDNGEHKVGKLDQYVAPFQQQLREVVNVAEGGASDHGTGNSVRSVLEAVGRFCRPDKKDLSQFLIFVSGDIGISIKSVLINSLSHGTYYDETPTPEDVKLACEEAIKVVEYFAPGQVEVVRAQT